MQVSVGELSHIGYASSGDRTIAQISRLCAGFRRVDLAPTADHIGGFAGITRWGGFRA
jgi:hypothetical protein